MSWEVIFFRDFDTEYEELPAAVQDELLAQLAVLERFGPGAGRPRVDMLKGSEHANMKELRLVAEDWVWRFAFAFDPNGARPFWSAATSQASARSDFTVNGSPRPIGASTHISIEAEGERKAAKQKVERKER